LVVKDTTTIEDALRVVVPALILVP